MPQGQFVCLIAEAACGSFACFSPGPTETLVHISWKNTSKKRAEARAETGAVSQDGAHLPWCPCAGDSRFLSRTAAEMGLSAAGGVPGSRQRKGRLQEKPEAHDEHPPPARAGKRLM